MSIIALLTGGFFGTLTALFALFGIGVEWSTGATIYFATAIIIALPIIGFGSVNSYKNKGGPKISDWEQEFHGYQPTALHVSDSSHQTRCGTSDRNAA